MDYFSPLSDLSPTCHVKPRLEATRISLDPSAILALGFARAEVRVLKRCELLLTALSPWACPLAAVALWVRARVALLLALAQ